MNESCNEVEARGTFKVHVNSSVEKFHQESAKVKSGNIDMRKSVFICSIRSACCKLTRS